jgi:hypothetical protein
MEKDTGEPSVYKAGEATSSGFTIENTLNGSDNSLPFGYFDPATNGKLTWICSEGRPRADRPPDIISLFMMDLGSHKDKRVTVLENVDQARFFRDELVKNGWQKLIPPKIEFTMDGSDKPLNRKQKRKLEKTIKNLAKTNRDGDL